MGQSLRGQDDAEHVSPIQGNQGGEVVQAVVQGEQELKEEVVAQDWGTGELHQGHLQHQNHFQPIQRMRAE